MCVCVSVFVLFLSAATIGFIVPISYPGLRTGTPSAFWINKLLRWASTLLLALHHVNSRNGSIVGNETLSRIPENFKISFKMKNSDFIPTGAAEALTTWTYMHRFLNDACRLLIPANLTVSSKAGITTEVLERCRQVDVEDKCQSTALHEAQPHEDIHGIVGVPLSGSSKIVSEIADLHKLPVISFGAVDSVLTKGLYPRFSRVNARSGPMLRAIVGIVKYFGWGAINVLNVGSSRAMNLASELVAVASTDGVTVASTHVFNREDADSIAQAATALSKSMYNSSALSRTRVTVLFADKLENIPLILEAAAKVKILGAGFVWLNVDMTGLRELIDSSGAFTNQHRRSFAGFLNM
jgi:hypothetical protein